MSRLKKYRMVLVEPSPVVVEGFKKLLAGNGEFEIVDTISEPQNMVERTLASRPDIVLINPAVVDYQKRSSVRHLFHLSAEMALVAVVYQFIEPDLLKQYNGVLTIYDDTARIVRKLRQMVASREQNTEVGDGYDLSDREREILVSVVKGLTNKEIADTHSISVHTVISHRKNITRKTGIKSVSGLTVYALLNGLVEQTDI